MEIPKLEKDLAFISKQGDDPSKEGLTTDEFKAEFDKAGLEIQKYLNETIVPTMEAMNASAVVMSQTRPNIQPVLWLKLEGE